MKRITKSAVALVGSMMAIQGFAAEGIIGPVTLDFVSVISKYNTHKPGNLEIGIKNGFSMPAGVYCDPNYITTLKSAENYDQMLTVLLAAHTAGRQVVLGINNDADRSAYPGRCGLSFVHMK